MSRQAHPQEPLARKPGAQEPGAQEPFARKPHARGRKPAGRVPLTPRQRDLFGTLLDTFLAQGFAGFAIDTAATRFHCSKSTLYALGATSDAVVRRVLVSFFQEVTRRTDQALLAPTPTQALADYFAAMAAALRPATPAFLHDLASTPVGQQVYATNTSAAVERIGELLRRGVDAGEFRPLPATLVGEFVAAAMVRIQQGELPAANPADAYAALGDLVVHGVLAD